MKPHTGKSRKRPMSKAHGEFIEAMEARKVPRSEEQRQQAEKWNEFLAPEKDDHD